MIPFQLSLFILVLSLHNGCTAVFEVVEFFFRMLGDGHGVTAGLASLRVVLFGEKGERGLGGRKASKAGRDGVWAELCVMRMKYLSWRSAQVMLPLRRLRGRRYFIGPFYRSNPSRRSSDVSGRSWSSSATVLASLSFTSCATCLACGEAISPAAVSLW